MRAFRNQPYRSVDRGAQIDSLLEKFELAGLDFGHIEDVVNQRQKVVPAIMNVLCVASVGFDAVIAEKRSFDDFGKSDHGVQRRAQLVTHIRQKIRFRPVRAFRCFLGKKSLPARLPQACFTLFQGGNVRAGYGKTAIRRRMVAYLKPAAVENRNVAACTELRVLLDRLCGLRLDVEFLAMRCRHLKIFSNQCFQRYARVRDIFAAGPHCPIARVAHNQLVRGIEQGDAIGQAFDRIAQALFAVAQRIFSISALGDIFRDRQDIIYFPCQIDQRVFLGFEDPLSLVWRLNR